MRKSIYGGLILVCLLCTGRAWAEKEPVVLEIMDGYVSQSKFIDNEIKLFEKANPDIKIKRNRLTNKRLEELLTLLFRGDGNIPDLIETRANSQSWYLHYDFIRDINTYAEKAGWRRRLPAKYRFLVENLDVYTFPTELQCANFYMFYNRKCFKQAGLWDKNKDEPVYPATMDEFKNSMIKLGQAGEKYGFTGLGLARVNVPSAGFCEWTVYQGAYSRCAYNFEEVDYRTGRPDMDHPAYVKTMKMLLEIKRKGGINPDFASAQDDIMRARFAMDQVAAVIGGYWNIQEWSNKFPDFKHYDVRNFPPPDKKGYRGLWRAGVRGGLYYLTKKAKHPDEAFRFIDWLASKEAGKRYVQYGMGLSIYPENNVKENFTVPQWEQYFSESRKVTVIGPWQFVQNRKPDLVKVTMSPVTPNLEEIFMGIMTEMIPEDKIEATFKEYNRKFWEKIQEAFAKAKKEGLDVDLSDLIIPDWPDQLHDYVPKKK
ncbi:MAG: ABC transporter substrate-binding protein [Bacillota bacterium]